MGEEKPDEEHMGKRMSSPRLSPTPLGAGTNIVTPFMENIRMLGKILRTAHARTRLLQTLIFCKTTDYGNITDNK
jgi:hypothetical protein